VWGSSKLYAHRGGARGNVLGRLEDVKTRGKAIEDELQRARQEAQQALQRFTAVKAERCAGVPRSPPPIDAGT
jgi:hypothetical protein